MQYLGDHTAGSASIARMQDVGVPVARVVAVTDATSITPASATSDVVTQTNTQAAGTLTLNNPTGSPNDEQRLALRVKCTNAQTLVYGNQYRGSNDLPLPLGTTGGTKTDRLLFAWNAVDSKWDFIGRTFGY